MDKFQVELSQNAKKFYENASLDLAQELNHCFQELETNPFRGPQIKRLKTRPQDIIYRYRIRDYRVIYEIFKKEVLVLVVKIAKRDDVYRK